MHLARKSVFLRLVDIIFPSLKHIKIVTICAEPISPLLHMKSVSMVFCRKPIIDQNIQLGEQKCDCSKNENDRRTDDSALRGCRINDHRPLAAVCYRAT